VKSMSTATKPEVTGFFDPDTYTISYIVADPGSKHCAIIDSVLDYNPNSGCTRRTSADQIIAQVRSRDLTVDYIIETHVHADHLTAAPYLQKELGGKSVIGFEVPRIQKVFGDLFNAEAAFRRDGSQFDVMLAEGDTLAIGGLTLKAMHTPGHTPACMTYIIGDAIFVGDTLFMPDYGTARCDFPGGDAAQLYRSIRRLFELPADYRMFMCHDYLPAGREQYEWETTVGAQRKFNIHVHEGISEADFVAMRTARDKSLDMPRLILQSVQVNMRAGHFPPAESNGMAYLKLPVDAF